MATLDSLLEGLAGSMRECLYCRQGCKAVILYDESTSPAAVLVEAAVRRIGGKPHMVDLGRLGKRPFKSLPPELAGLLERVKPDATFYAAGVMPGELEFRRELIEAATGMGARHVHMPRVNVRVLHAASRCREAAEATMRAYEYLQGARRLVVRAPGGTRVEVRVGSYRWVPDTGVIHPGEWGNWPPGEVFTTPDSVDGEIVVDGVLGDYFSTKYGVLREQVLLHVERGRITGVSGGAVARELWEYLSRAGDCGLRIGEVGVGTNPAVREPIGIILHDEKMPGIHFAAGDPLGEMTGAEWKCSVHVDMLPLRATVEVGGVKLVSNGRLLVHKL